MERNCSHRRARHWKILSEQRKLLPAKNLSRVILSGVLSIRSANGQTESKDPKIGYALDVSRSLHMIC